MNIISIDPLKIIPAPWNTRSEIDEASIRALSVSIKADGIIQTPNCIRNANGDIVCFDGNRRVAAACLCGFDEIEVNLCDITEEEAKVKTVTANLQREEDDPLLAASVIASIGGDPEVIASKLGKTAAWVRRRSKLNALTDEMKAFAGKVTLEVLERVSDLDADRQKKLAKKIESRVKYSNGNTVKWVEVKWDVKNLTVDLDEAKFDTADCVNCAERTGADWFADGEEGLGQCLNCSCYERKREAYKAALVAAAIPAGAEREEVEYRWSLPDEVRNGERRKWCKKYPCAYYWFEDGEIKVLWGRSRAAIDADREKAEAERERQREKERAENEKEAKVRGAIDEYITENADPLCVALRGTMKANDTLKDLAAEAFGDWLGGYHNDGELAEIVVAFDLDADALPGEIAEDELIAFVEKNTATEED